MELEALASIGRLSDRIYAILKGKILQGSLPPDEHLPLEQIARNLGVSTTPVRDALNLLAADGLVEWIPRRGAFVTKLSLQTVEEVFQIREFL
ncbi:MAG TPA: GntR family transcriptional regulator, partial [Anaerolineae bacterium]|nr:GntR family transcriptional regulator [Anaerolineae bacterium]